VIFEFLKARLNRGRHPELYFYRDTHGNEVDLVLREGRTLIPVEIKSAATFALDCLKGIAKFRKTLGKRCADGFVLYQGNKRFMVKGTETLNPVARYGKGDFLRIVE
jgi:predicted AAA+ superfamily ATPase